MKVYAARDKNTGKFVSDLTSRSKKFWERKNACVEAISNYNSHSYRFRNYNLELVELVCVESKDYENFNKLAKLYINETSCDGQLFCGCRYEDCEKFHTEECYKCLLKHIAANSDLCN